MKINKVIIPLLIIVGCLLIVGCSDYQEQFTFTGTVEEKLVEDEMLVIKEYGQPEGRKPGNTYEIPVKDLSQYDIGQKLEVTVFSNTDDDIWALDHMKFEIKGIDE